MEIIVLSGFVFALLGCILFDLNILIALGIGFCLFFGYGLFRKFSFREMSKMRILLSGFGKFRNILAEPVP